MGPSIEFDPSEHYNSPLSDGALRLIALFVDRDTYDKLLYAGDKFMRIHAHSRTIKP